MTSLTKVAKNTIKEFIHYIDDENFAEFYNKLVAKRLNPQQTDLTFKDISDITRFFENDCGINPLNYLTYIPNYYHCSDRGLVEFNIPDNITSIGNSSFRSCFNLTKITIPRSVRSIDAGAFFSCFKLTKINFCGTMQEWAKIYKAHNYWKGYSDSTYTITCIDGDIKFK